MVRMLLGVMALIAAGGTALAQSPDPSAVQTPIQGATAMGDKGRGGPDGWAQAPVTRGEGAGKPATGEASTMANAPSSQPSPAGGRTLPPGQDPATPAQPAAMPPK